MTAHDFQWVIGLLGGSLVVVVGAFVTLLIFAFRVGRRDAGLSASEKQIGEALTEIKKYGERLSKVDELARGFEQMAEFMRRVNSDVSELKTKTIRLEARDEMRSSPSYHGEE